jgi:hypothetical protein
VLLTRIIEDDATLACFIRCYSARAGVTVDLSYLRSARVRAFFDASGELAAGYVLNCEAPFRYLSALPGTDADILGTSRVDDFCEFTCIWIDRQVHQLDRIALYSWCFVDFLRAGKWYALGGSTHPGVVAMQQQALPHVVYDGPACIDGEQIHAWVYYGSLRTGFKGFARDLMRRLMRSFRGATVARGR